MPLLAFWKSNPSETNQLAIEQVVGNAGDGNLKDNSDCSIEFRAFLSEVSSAKLRIYIERCLTTPLNKGGLILQDLINELGRRLEYKVENGRLYDAFISYRHVDRDRKWAEWLIDALERAVGV
jgi:hypothetical protein